MNEIGEILKEARIEKGYTLDDLQQITKIQKRYLQAIEDGNMDILPGRFYSRAFVKQYADIVGLDGEELLEEHLSETPEEASEEFAENVNVSPTRTQVKEEGIFDRISEYLPTILIFLLVAAILIAIYFAFRNMPASDNGENALINEENTEQVEPPVTEDNNDEADGSGEENTDDEEEEEEEPEDDGEQEASITESSGSSTTYEITGPHPDEQTLTLTADGGDSWVSISVSGGANEQALLSAGQSLSVDFGADTTEIDIVIGNASVTTVTLNDKELEYAPESSGIVKQDWHLQFVD